MESKITLIGMENYLQSYNDSLFADLVLPNGVDKEDLINNILLTHGEFETLYADADYMKLYTTVWGKKWYRTIDKWVKVLNKSYEPLENYDRREEITESGVETHTGTSQLDRGGYDEKTQTFNNLTDTYDGTVSEKPNDWITTTTPDTTDTVETETVSEKVKTTTETQVSAFDSSDYSNQNKVTVDVSPQTNGAGNVTSTTSHEGSDTVEQSGQYDTDTDYTNTKSGSITDRMDLASNEVTTNNLVDDMSHSRSAKIHGNIGVTTSQQMLQAELDVQRFNLINEITNLYATELLVLVY